MPTREWTLPHGIDTGTLSSGLPNVTTSWKSTVALKAIELAGKAAGQKGFGDRCSHVGFYLVDKGLQQVQSALGVRQSAYGRRLGNAPRTHPLVCFMRAR